MSPFLISKIPFKMLRTLIPRRLTTTSSTLLRQPTRLSSSSSSSPSQAKIEASDQEADRKANASSSDEGTPSSKKPKTVAEADAELALKMSGLAGDGGEAGVELEDGQPVSMKRSVRNNMFRYI